MTASPYGPDNADTGVEDGDAAAPTRSGWMVDVATHRVFRVTPQGGEKDTPAHADRETGEGDQA